MSRELDALTASTLKYLRERWWDDGFAKFLAEVLQPEPGCRLLDVGCGPGTAGDPVREFARVTRPGGRVLVVEPDNSARYWYSSSESGMQAFEVASRFYNAVALSHGDTTDPAIGPRLTQVFVQHGIQPLSVRMFPVSVTRIGSPPWEIWENRLEVARQATERARDEAIRRLGIEYRQLLERYAEEAAVAGRDFVEIQSTPLFATSGRRLAE